MLTGIGAPPSGTGSGTGSTVAISPRTEGGFGFGWMTGGGFGCAIGGGGGTRCVGAIRPGIAIGWGVGVIGCPCPGICWVCTVSFAGWNGHGGIGVIETYWLVGGAVTGGGGIVIPFGIG